jgi:hypothetical protein
MLRQIVKTTSSLSKLRKAIGEKIKFKIKKEP